MRQLPVEGKRYQTMDRMWRKVMQAAKGDPKVYMTCVCVYGESYVLKFVLGLIQNCSLDPRPPLTTRVKLEQVGEGVIKLLTC